LGDGTDEDGQTAGAVLTLPDFNQVLKHLHGRLLPFGWLKALWLKRKINRVRVFALGVKPKYRKTGVAAYLYAQHFFAAKRTGVIGGSMGWILEVNKPMNQAMEALAGDVTKRLRLYERPLAKASSQPGRATMRLAAVSLNRARLPVSCGM
jgi:GNAT superfamily N-acetyltransferase